MAASFVWGILSIILSPCHLASIPLIVGFIDQQGQMTTRRAFGISTLFSVGILITIALIGLITAAAGRMVGDIGRYGNYFVATIFFLVGLIPDIAIARDRAVGWKKVVYTILSAGWQGTGKQWKAHSRAVLHLSGLATPLVLSVHSIVSWDFAMSIVPGWHATIFAPCGKSSRPLKANQLD